jgi:glycosyltransferase involved in cell wall biosynthesis
VSPAGRPIIYLSHNGAASALARSQVIPYLEGLSDRGFNIELFTFERDGIPVWRPEHGLAWHPIRSRPGSSILDKVLDIASGILAVLYATVVKRVAFIHARSYVAAAVALVVGAITRRPYVFDMRGFLPEEFREVGYWSARDIRYRALRFAEPLLLSGAAEIVVLTNLAAARLRSDRQYTAARERSITVIPCAVDLRRFAPNAAVRDHVLVYAGSLGSFYEFDAMLRVLKAARALRPGSRMLILNQRDHALVAAAAERVGVARDALTVIGVRPDEMPEQLARACVGIALVRQSPSKAASSAVKVAEYLACGLPVIVNAGLGDVSDQVRATRAGHVVDDYSDFSIERAGAAVIELAETPAYRERARALAEAEYDLLDATERYAAIYRRLAPAR